MGAGYSSGGTTSSTSESKLSKQQAEILKTHEAQYQQYFFPELLSGIKDASGGVNESSMMQGQARAINQQAGGAKQQFAQAMAQRGLSGTGVEAQGLSSIGNARGQALADAYYNVQQANQDQKMRYIQLGLGMSPTPTTAAPLNQSSETTNGWSFGIGK